MSLQRRHFEGIARFKSEHFVIELDLQLSAENKEDLPGMMVEMSHLAATSWDALLDYCQIRSLQKTPTVTDFTPPVVFRRRLISHHRRDFCPSHEQG